MIKEILIELKRHAPFTAPDLKKPMGSVRYFDIDHEACYTTEGKWIFSPNFNDTINYFNNARIYTLPLYLPCWRSRFYHS